MVVFVWAFSAIRSPYVFLWLHSGIADLISIRMSCLVGTFVVYFRIFVVVLHQRKQVVFQLPQGEQLPATDQNTRRSKLFALNIRSSSLNGFCLYLVFLVRYLPHFCIWIVTNIPNHCYSLGHSVEILSVQSNLIPCHCRQQLSNNK